MDACTDPSVKEIVVMAAAQTGKSEALLNLIGYHIHLDPAPILVMQPSLEMARAFSNDRLTSGLLETTACLRGLVSDAKSRDSGNTILSKSFPGGHVTLVGANSPASLASRPIRIVMCDEVDRYPPSAGAEGDPVALAKKRSATFWNRLLLLTSTPTVKGGSRIESAYEETDQRKYYVQCQHCSEHFVLEWKHVHWEGSNPKTASVICPECGVHWTDADRHNAVRHGEWRATAPFHGAAGFHLNALVSPWVQLSDVVEEFLHARKDPMRMRTFVNTVLAETFEEQGEGVDDYSVSKRKEDFRDIPEEVVLLTAGVDVQDDRLEVEIVGWTKGEESWSLQYHVLYGDPSTPQMWAKLDELLLATYHHPLGIDMVIRSTCIDSGGHHTRAVYNYAKTRAGHRVFAIKGVGGEGKPLVGRPSKNNIGKVPLYPVGVDTAKEIHYSRLKITEPGPGYCHFPADRDEEYFKQLTAEKQVTRYHKGFPKREWIKTRTRNEALDVRVYAIAALSILNVNMDSVYHKFYDNVERIKAPSPEAPKPHPLAEPKKIARKRGSGGFATNWR